MMTRADVFDRYLSIAAGQFSVVSMLWRCLIGFSLGHPMESLNPTVAGPSFADNHAYALWIGAGFAALTLVGFAGAIGDRLRRSSSSRSENRSNHRSDFALVVSCLLAVTASGVVLASIGRRDVWSRYLSPITPIYYLLLVYGLFELRRMSRIVFVASTALVALAFGLALNWYYTDVQFARDDFRGVAQFIAANGTGDDAVVCGSSYWTVAVDYYRPGAKPCEPAIDEYPLDEAATAARLRRITGANRFVWLVLWQDYFSDPTGYVERWLGTEGLLVIDKPLHGLRVKGYYTRAPLVDERDVPNRGTWRIGDQVQLLGYDVSPAVAGATSKVTLYWRTSAPIGEDYTTYVHLVSTPYQVWAQQDSPPLRGSYGTSKWQTGDILRDEYDLAIPAFTPPGDYQLEIGLYSAKTGQRIGGSGSDRANLGPVHVEATPAGTGLPISVRRDPVHFADVASLVAVSGEGRAKPGSDFRFELYWQDDQPAKASYTTFVHVVDSAGRIIAQGDAPPTLGVYPTSRWRAGEVVRDPREIHIPVEVPSGRYDVLVGLYDAASGSRLAVRPVESSDSGPLVWLRPAPTPQPTGDTTKVMSLIVE